MTIFCSRTGEPDPFADEDHVRLNLILMHIPKRRLNDHVVDGPPYGCRWVSYFPDHLQIASYYTAANARGIEQTPARHKRTC